MKKRAKVLVVDDEDVIRESLRDWLTNTGYEVFTAENGQQALEIIKREGLRIVIADLVMPVMDGIELLKQAKKLSPDIKVIIITAYGSIPNALAAIREGAYDYIEKPFCPERVEILIEKLVERQKLIEENLSLQKKLFENVINKSSPLERELRQVEKEHILNILAQTKGNYAKAARVLGISRMTLYNKAKAYGIKEISRETASSKRR
jgi:DNA-binding NtrC family response regulator